jgi:16S rRNA (guanine527-N7)-methyltransferase
MEQGNGDEQTQWKTWRQACLMLELEITDTQEEAFQRFSELLIAANRQLNLTRITALEDFLYRHLLDSLSLSAFLPTGSLLADIGSGAGFPAIPLAMARPDLQVTAVESVGKKCAFIQETIEKLRLTNLKVLNTRGEHLGHDPQARERFDRVTARAVAALPVLLEYCLPLVKVGGSFLAMKGLNFEAELADSKNALHRLSGRLQEIKKFTQPDLSHLAGSRILNIEKTGKTPATYPRHAGLIRKKPL